MGSYRVCINVWWLALLILSHFSQMSHGNEIIWSHLSETKLFHINRIFKNGACEGVQATP